MPGLIGLDWGTTTLRAYRVNAPGRQVEMRSRCWGLRRLPDGGFAAALADITAGWPKTPRLACGMVGSRQGWHETAYVEAPAGAAQLAHALGRVEIAEGRNLFIVPGVHQRQGPDVMRGEETQLVGVLALYPGLAAHATCVLPGTHSKWASIRDGAISDFATVMTGELYALLIEHSILHGAAAAATDDDAFLSGVVRARDSGAAGAWSQLFSARALMLDGALQAGSVPDYVSGLLIGEEWRSMLAARRFDTAGPIQLVGDAPLCARYRKAAHQFDLEAAAPVADAAATGLWQIALQAGLVCADQPSTCAGAS